jgi:hypothetical protein
MSKLLFFACFLIPCTALRAQTKPYFQQEVNYKIDCTLDDKTHTLKGEIEISYINNSRDELTFIYFHLWANAFKEPNTAYGQQELRTGSTRFYFAKDSERGYYTGLDFTVDGEKVEWRFDSVHPDIAIVQLPNPLRNRAKVTIRTPFTLKIPASFSRLGHVGQSYQMTQWFPKPAVYDNRGWHPMPYLDLGEFYSEFGSFDISITLPENYVVGATGILDTESEREFLAKKILETKGYVLQGFPKSEAFPPSSGKMKTIRFKADKVHDFAWFADKRFHVLRDEARLPSGRTIDAWAMFTNAEADLWARGAEYVRRAVEFYSHHVGEYPYPHATAVHSALSAGGGMEYPMITVIGNSGSAKALDDVITHEVGHNWFYGLLANNEREHAWLDEGMNSYYEYRYLRDYYGSRSPGQLPGFMERGTDTDFQEAGYLLQARRRLDQAPETTSNGFSPINYGIGAYMKPGLALEHLEKYLGTERFDAIMQSFFKTWRFAHPYPEDLRSHFERESGKDLGWFFDGYIGSTKRLDYAVKNIGGDQWKVTVVNKGELAAPFPVSSISHSELVDTKWYDGFEGTQEISFPKGEFDLLAIDWEHATLDVNRTNNYVKTGGIFKKTEPLDLNFIYPIQNSRRSALGWLPLAGWNAYDGFMAGLALYNAPLPVNRVDVAWAPLYGFESKDLNGLAALRFNFFPKSEKIKQVSLGMTSKAFHYFQTKPLATENGTESPHLQYRRIVPFLRVELERSPLSRFYQTLQVRSILLETEEAVFSGDSTPLYTGKEWNGTAITELSWEVGNRRALNLYSLRLAFEHQSYDDPFGKGKKLNYVRANMELNAAYTYDRGRNFRFRLFAGGFLMNDARKRGFVAPGAYNMTMQGFNDYRFDGFYFDRMEPTGFFSQQISLGEGGMKVPLGSAFEDGRSNDFLLAVNLKADLPQDLPGKLPIKPYFDIGYFHDARPISSDLSFEDQVWWQGGFALEFAGGMVGIYVPVVNSRRLRGDDKLPGLYDQSGRNGFFERIAFVFDLGRLDPWKMRDELQF